MMKRRSSAVRSAHGTSKNRVRSARMRAERSRGAAIAASTHASSLASRVLNSFSGSTSAHGSANTVNGSIRGALGSSQWAESLEFQSVNGSITLDLPADLSADVDAETVNGRIDVDFPLTGNVRKTKRELRGTIGGGGRPLDLETVNGSITLRKH